MSNGHDPAYFDPDPLVVEGDLDPRMVAQLETVDKQKKAARQAAIDTSIQKGAWGQFGSPAGGPSVAQQPAPVDPFQQQIQREMLDQVEARKRAGQAQIAAMEERAKITGERSAKLGKEIEEAPQIPMPNVPKPPPIPTREQSIDPTAAKSLFAVASVIGALGMMGGRGRGMLAMSGMTGMIQGFQEGNAEKYKAAKDQYDRAVDEQLNTYRMEYQQYLAKVQNQKDTWAQRILAINLQARAAGDKAMIAATEAGNADAVFGQLMDFEEMIGSLEHAKDNTRLLQLRERTAELGVHSKELDIAKKEREAVEGTPAQQEKRKQFEASVNALDVALDKAKAALPELDKQGLLAKGPGRGSYSLAQFRRWMKPGSEELAAWQTLQAAIVGIDRTVLGDMGPRAIKAFSSALDLFEKPYTRKGLENAFNQFKEFVAEARKARLGEGSQAPQSSGGGAMRSKDIDGKPIWKLPNETTWHYE